MPFLEYTDMTITRVTERVSIYYSGQLSILKYLLNQACGPIEMIDDKKFKAFKSINILIENKIITLEWIASPVNDMYANAIVATVLQSDSLQDSSKKSIPLPSVKMDRMHFKECLIEMLQEMFGEDSVPKIFKGEKLYVTVDGKKANIDFLKLSVSCEEDPTFQQIVQSAVTKLYQSLSPPKVDDS